MAVKKTIDTWKTKQWYTVVAPKFLGEVHTTLVVPSSDEANLTNRVVTLPLKEITRDFAHVYTTVRLRISDIKNKNAFTKFIGHSLAREFIATLVRRRREALDVHLPLESKDGVEFQLSALLVTPSPCSEKQKKALRNSLSDELKKRSAAADFVDFIRAILFQQLAAELRRKLSKVYPVKSVEITKTQLYEEFDVQQLMEVPTVKTGERAQSPPEAPAIEEQAVEATAEAPATA